MSEVDRALCRENARECVRLANLTLNPDTKATLLARSQEWLRLAYADNDADFVRLLTEFNQRQLEIEPEAPPPLPSLVERQPIQQQQSKARGRK